ncbi:MAG: hypothetical protein ACUVT1_09155, partial [Anaerolineae bacterium]
TPGMLRQAPQGLRLVSRRVGPPARGPGFGVVTPSDVRRRAQGFVQTGCGQRGAQAGCSPDCAPTREVTDW